MGFFGSLWNGIKKVGKGVYNAVRKVGKAVVPIVRKVSKAHQYVGENMNVIKNIPIVGSYVKQAYDATAPVVSKASEIADTAEQYGLA